MTKTSEVRPGIADRGAGRDMRGVWRILAALVITLGPLSIAVGRGVMPYWTTDDAAAMVSGVLEHQQTMDALLWGGIIVSPALLLGVLAIAHVARRGAPLLATLGAAFGFLAWTMGSATANMDYLVSRLGANGFDQATIVRIGDAVQNSAFAATCGIIWLIGHIAGMVLTGVALGRAGIINWWIAGALIVSQPIHFIAAVVIPSRLLDVTLGWGLTTIASAFVSLAVLRMSNDQWDLGPAARIRAMR
ncbi:hypothetical protein BLJ79_12835 [Arthrobacter sp. UCD-GKA]|uniref:hypothetical protein n=1 Tax=Arthrobacter sp. UCD-GKA TaxID=1913576 RepID=UPI0008DE3F09|nr:hypothetical protein [Arthrobacter sp. UCD-GKA]OIH84336.1 hypothetical protein BLJ79_12835 [Arthrobacter sp. UCD-GKA]